MININGRTFVKTVDDFVNTLFTSGGTATGYYKVMKKGVRIYDKNNNIIAFIVNNGYNDRFIVSATDTPNGIRYSMSTSSLLDKTLGLDKLGYMETMDLADEVLKGVGQ